MRFAISLLSVLVLGLTSCTKDYSSPPDAPPIMGLPAVVYNQLWYGQGRYFDSFKVVQDTVSLQVPFGPLPVIQDTLTIQQTVGAIYAYGGLATPGYLVGDDDSATFRHDYCDAQAKKIYVLFFLDQVEPPFLLEWKLDMVEVFMDRQNPLPVHFIYSLDSLSTP